MIEQVFIALIGGEPETVIELIHPQAEWTPTLWSGEQTYKGREGVREWLAQFGDGLEYLDHQVEQMRMEGDRGAVQGTVSTAAKASCSRCGSPGASSWRTAWCGAPAPTTAGRKRCRRSA